MNKMKTTTTRPRGSPAAAGSDLGKVLFTVPAHEYHYWQMQLLHPLRSKVERVKAAGSSGTATRRELEKALKLFHGKWQAEELRSLLNDLNTEESRDKGGEKP
jgi:hypothetical protein